MSNRRTEEMTMKKFLLSAGLSYVISRRLGLIRNDDRATIDTAPQL